MRAHLEKSVLRARLLVGTGAASALVLASTWSALPWSLGSSLYFFCFGAMLEILGRRTRGFSDGAPIVVGIGVAIGSVLFRQETSSLTQDAHAGAVTLLSMVVGMAAGGVLVKDVKAARGRNKKVVMTREEVATVIHKFLDGSGGKWDWDDFLSFPIDDPDLDRIRFRCASLSAEFPAAEGYCGPEGFDVLEEYVRQLREESPQTGARGRPAGR